MSGSTRSRLNATTACSNALDGSPSDARAGSAKRVTPQTTTMRASWCTTRSPIRRSVCLHWDPNVKTLERHVYDVIQMRTNYDLKRARKFRRESLDALTTDGEPSAMAEVDAALLDRASDASAETTARAAERMAALRQLATGDRLVLGLLDASASGATSKVDLMRITGFSSAEYLNGRRRLRRLVAQLSSLHSPANKGD